MRDFRFENICLLSNQEQRARAIRFKRTNLLFGQNHTGKSTLIKMLFSTLGANPKGALAEWDKEAIALVEFSFDGRRYTVVHQNAYRALFSENDELIAACGSHAEWTSALATTLGFNLVLPDKKGNAIQADARCFFLPFYINQDGSWLAGWETFTGLQQYQKPVNGILEYFTGVKPPEWYTANSKRIAAQRSLEEVQREYQIVTGFRERFGKTLSLSGPKTLPAVFEQDIDRLTQQMTSLNAKQERKREELVREQDALASARLQAELATEALSSYDGDATFMRRSHDDTLTCPTCGAEHDRSFLDVLTFAEDARVLRELSVRLNDDVKVGTKRYEVARSQLVELEEQYRAVSNVLSTRRGELRLDDVVRSLGAETAFEAFESELSELKSEVDRLTLEVANHNAKLAELTNSKRSKEILSLFRQAYSLATIALNMPSAGARKMRLTSRPNVSGSGGPRSILAYYAALWTACLGPHASFSVPLVVDSPQQQGQDDENLPRMIKYIATSLPENAQVILGAETSTEEPFDQIIELNEPYHVLKADEFVAVHERVAPYVGSMYAALLNREPQGSSK